jgi:hypothetical protein
MWQLVGSYADAVLYIALGYFAYTRAPRLANSPVYGAASGEARRTRLFRIGGAFAMASGVILLLIRIVGV